jgi:hypothetical protein
MLTIPDADPLPLPAPPTLLWALLLLTFFLHVLAMNFVLGGSILLVVARWRNRAESSKAVDLFRKALPTAVAAAITFGVAPLLFLQTLYGRVFFSSAVLMAWLWLAIVPLVMLAYYGAYFSAFRGLRTWVAAGVALLLITVAFIQTTNMSLMLQPAKFLPLYVENARGFHVNLSDATFVPRYLHMLLGALAVAGFVAFFYGKKKNDEWATRFGLRWFVVATLLNVATGLWWMLALPREVMMRTSLWVGIGTAAMIVALILRSAWALVATLATMVFARDAVRQGMLDLAGFANTTNVAPQWDVFAIFAVLLVGALATTAWMGWLLMRPARSDG